MCGWRGAAAATPGATEHTRRRSLDEALLRLYLNKVQKMLHAKKVCGPFKHAHAHMDAHTHMHTQECTRTRRCTRTDTPRAHARTHTNAHMDAQTHTHSWTHAHTHAHARLFCPPPDTKALNFLSSSHSFLQWTQRAVHTSADVNSLQEENK